MPIHYMEYYAFLDYREYYALLDYRDYYATPRLQGIALLDYKE